MKNLSFITILTVLAAVSLSCSNHEPAISNNTVVSKTVTPRPTVDREADAQREIREKEQQKALSDFVSKNYQGWTISGTAAVIGECEGVTECDLHLTKQGQTKVVKVVFREFYRPDGTSYPLVFEIRPIDLLLNKLESERDTGREIERVEAEEERQAAREIAEWDGREL